MTQQPDYLRYLESAKKAEFAEQLGAQGFTVETEEPLDDVRFDLVARKGPRSIAYAFKAGRSTKTNKESLERLQHAARKAGWEFRIVVVNPPPRVHVEVERLSEQLLDHMINDLPSELAKLSSHTIIEGVSDLEVSDIHVGPGEIRAAGTGSVEVELSYGGGSDDITSSGNAFPFTFKVTLSPDGRLNSVEELTVDTSSFYE